MVFYRTRFRFNEKSLNEFHNWVFVAKKLNSFILPFSFSENSVVQLKSKIVIEKHIEKSNSGERIIKNNITSDKGIVYENADLIIELLNELDSNTSIVNLIEKTERKFSIQIDKNAVLMIVKEMVMDGTLEIVNLNL